MKNLQIRLKEWCQTPPGSPASLQISHKSFPNPEGLGSPEMPSSALVTDFWNLPPIRVRKLCLDLIQHCPAAAGEILQDRQLVGHLGAATSICQTVRGP